MDDSQLAPQAVEVASADLEDIPVPDRLHETPENRKFSSSFKLASNQVSVQDFMAMDRVSD